ncbi:MAG: ApaG domain [Verrucomicrobiota bacterium]
MNSSGDFLEPPGLWVSVDRVIYDRSLPAPADRPHSFVYFITIHNDTDQPITIKGRKWVVVNDRNEILALEGDGVVGKFPTIAPGDVFSYNSRHVLDKNHAVAEGSYIGLDAHGHKVLVRIPKFKMVVPD